MRGRQHQTQQANVRALVLPLALGLTLGACRMLDASAPISFEPIVYTSPGDVEVPVSTQRSSGSMSVMLIGDSLSVGPFGDRMLAYFRQKLEPAQYNIYAACGSSPESWLKDSPDFITPCGFRMVTARESWKTDYHDGKKPRPVRTPKLASIISKSRPPQLVIVQMGTNWMDEFVGASDLSGDLKKIIIRKFITEIRAKTTPYVQIVWVLPPDSSKYSSRLKDAVDRWINDCARELKFKTINTRGFTDRYVKGKSGADGVHLNAAAGHEWANGVIKRLPKITSTVVSQSSAL